MPYIIIILVLAALDQITKQLMYNVAGGTQGFSIPLIKRFFHLTYVENHGGVFGLLQGKINLFTIASAVLIVYVIDMIDFRGIWAFVFNVADMYVHIGIYIIIIDYLARKYFKK